MTEYLFYDISVSYWEGNNYVSLFYDEFHGDFAEESEYSEGFSGNFGEAKDIFEEAKTEFGDQLNLHISITGERARSKEGATDLLLEYKGD
jgi:hypothetical protein